MKRALHAALTLRLTLTGAALAPHPPGLGHFSSGFLLSFEKSRGEEQEQMSHTEENIVSLLDLCSRVRAERATGLSGTCAPTRLVCLEHDAAASRGYGDRQRAEEHAGRAGQ